MRQLLAAVVLAAIPAVSQASNIISNLGSSAAFRLLSAEAPAASDPTAAPEPSAKPAEAPAAPQPEPQAPPAPTEIQVPGAVQAVQTNDGTNIQIARLEKKTKLADAKAACAALAPAGEWKIPGDVQANFNESAFYAGIYQGPQIGPTKFAYPMWALTGKPEYDSQIEAAQNVSIIYIVDFATGEVAIQLGVMKDPNIDVYCVKAAAPAKP